jgi:hypothetical protein
MAFELCQPNRIFANQEYVKIAALMIKEGF